MNMFEVFVKHDRIYFSVGNQSFQLAYEPEDEPEWSAGQAAEWYMGQLRNALSRLQSNDAQAEIAALQQDKADALEVIDAVGKVVDYDFSGGLVEKVQVEIAKRDARITKLEKKAELPMKYKRMQFNAELQREVAEQAAEIARLKGVIAKCEEVIEQYTTREQDTINGSFRVCCSTRPNEPHSNCDAQEAFAAIKEEVL